MLLLMTFFLYNSVTTVRLLPTKYLKTMSHTNVINSSNSLAGNIFMHIIVKNVKELNINLYMPHINQLNRDYPTFNYHLYVLLNDTYTTDTIAESRSDEENNEDALNTLFSKDISNKEFNKNNSRKLKIIHTTLSRYLDKSPLLKKWREMPSQFIPFLVRTTSIWDKGGIAFNPEILLPDPSNSLYTYKLLNILRRYGNLCHKEEVNKENIYKTDFDQRSNNTLMKNRQKINNIRDIIEALEKDDPSNSTISQFNPIEEETHTINHVINLRSEDKISNTRENSTQNIFPNHTKLSMNDTIKIIKRNLLNKLQNNTSNSVSTIGSSNAQINYVNNKRNIANFTNKPQDNETKIGTREKLQQIIQRYHPKVITTKPAHHDDFDRTELCENNSKLIVDLKGNIIATEIPCHAFIGTLFSNANQYSEEDTITDYIIRKLSVFCKGLLSSCKGIEVILI